MKSHNDLVLIKNLRQDSML